MRHLPETPGFQDPARERFPALVLVAAGSPCNLKCDSCPCTQLPEIRATTGRDGGKAPYLTPGIYRTIADQCREHALDGFAPRIRISGYGEPLMNKNILEMIGYSCTQGVPTSLITNGLLLTPEKAEALIEAGPESIEISVDAHNGELYAKVRAGGDFGRLTENIRNLLEIRNRNQPDRRTMVMVSAVRNHLTEDHIDAIRKFWQDFGVDHVSIRTFLTWNVPGLQALQARLSDRQTNLSGDAPCPQPFERLMVDPGGWIRLCPFDDQKKIAPFGHVSDTPLAEAWTGERFRAVRSCHGERFDFARAREHAPLCADCEDRLNRSWTFNYLSIMGRKQAG